MIEFSAHYDMLILTPCIGIAYGQCANPACDESHWRINLSWIFWTVEFYL